MPDSKTNNNEPAKTVIKPIRSSEYKLHYVNNTQIKASFYDIRIISGEVERDENDGLIFREDVGMVFSPQHAKAVLKIFQERIENYENKFGEIPTIENSIPPVEDHI